MSNGKDTTIHLIVGLIKKKFEWNSFVKKWVNTFLSCLKVLDEI